MLGRTASNHFTRVVFVVWSLVVSVGILLLDAFTARPGTAGAPPANWPRASRLPFDDHATNLLIFLHPGCPCSGASITELAYVLERSEHRVSAHPVVIPPDDGCGQSSGWTNLDELGVARIGSTWIDEGGTETRRFRVGTSGHVLVYEPDGRLSFSGGITSARGHAGQSFGRDAVLARVTRADAAIPVSPVFGCPLLIPR